MSWSKLVAASLVVTFLSACGFEPIAAPGRGSLGEEQDAIQLASVGIEVDGISEDDRFVYTLRKELTRHVDIDVVGADSLEIKVYLSEQGLAVQQDDTITRLNFRASTTYMLKNGHDPEANPIQGNFQSITATNATASQFSTGVASRQAYERLAVDIARKVETMLRLNRSGLLPKPDPAG